MEKGFSNLFYSMLCKNNRVWLNVCTSFFRCLDLFSKERKKKRKKKESFVEKLITTPPSDIHFQPLNQA